ncbi:M20 family metallo-hydrolase [Bacillus chungangensis]|uniref:N-carbamoyl-L-amino-acid hydrolase n=1 Tax=Bacillus chungangensis TaxID=587633 RepID=A0ABT9WV56_9BACI|nr:M20 family metallo-hydrolase [Bacillus chungangensis]MDQ0177186.1 N-carbamoyl-L-amino-acid hydrolase [Bacillus chungangensis]
MKEWLKTHLHQLNHVATMKQSHSFNRPAYSEEEWQAMERFFQIARTLELDVRRDEAGNCIARWEPEHHRNLPAVATGSHLDTVKNGGGYDGTAGVLCGLGAVKQLKDQGFIPTYPIEVICFAGEESARFGISTIGSKAMTGVLNPDEVAHIKDEVGISLQAAVEERGLCWSKINSASRPQQEIKSFIELHIEQGRQLQDAQVNVGVVRGIACPIRLKLTINGMAGHTGSTPMGKRRDALVAAAPLITYVSETSEQLSEKGELPLVATVSTICLLPNAMNVIPAKVELGIDIRSVDDSLKKVMKTKIMEKCTYLEKVYHVTIQLETLVDQPSIDLPIEQRKKLRSISESLGYKCLEMDSGAGHDCMNMAQNWPTALLFIPCRDGISHHQDEHASLQDLERGTEIVAAYLEQEAGTFSFTEPAS